MWHCELSNWKVRGRHGNGWWPGGSGCFSPINRKIYLSKKLTNEKSLEQIHHEWRNESMLPFPIENGGDWDSPMFWRIWRPLEALPPPKKKVVRSWWRNQKNQGFPWVPKNPTVSKAVQRTNWTWDMFESDSFVPNSVPGRNRVLGTGSGDRFSGSGEPVPGIGPGFRWVPRGSAVPRFRVQFPGCPKPGSGPKALSRFRFRRLRARGFESFGVRWVPMG